MALGVLERCKRSLAKSLTLAALVGGALFMHPSRVEAYDTNTIHPALVEKLAQFYQPQQLTFDLEAVKTGSINEDSPDQTYVRAFHHFTHWQTGEGLPGFFSSYVWATRPDIQEAFPFGDHTWQRAVDDVKNNSTFSENGGYNFHLQSDLTVPAHVRADIHISYIDGDSYEAWTSEHMSQIMDKVQPQSIPQVNDLQQLMTELSQFTGAHFYSDDSIDGTIQTTTVQEGRRTYQMGNVEGKTVHVLREGFFFDYLDVTCLSDQWRVLGTKAVEYGAAAIILLEKELPTCTPDCYNKECGSDSCGSSCGSCSSDQYCGNGTCIDEVTCTDQCAYVGEKACDSELNGLRKCQANGECLEWGPFGMCNTDNDYFCKEGECVYDPSCEASCVGKQCGPDDCGGNCGSCGPDQLCNNSTGQCSDQCSDLCPYEGYSDPGCAGTGLHLCGYLDGDSCLEWKIESCPANHQCKSGECVYDPICQSNCSGKECGSDGCNGSCGSCGSGESCQDGSCVSSCDPINGCYDTGCVFYDNFDGALDTTCKWKNTNGESYNLGGQLHLPPMSNVDNAGIFNCPNDFTLDFYAKSTSADFGYVLLMNNDLGLIVGGDSIPGGMRLNCGIGGSPITKEITGINLTSFTNVTISKQNGLLTLSAGGKSVSMGCGGYDSGLYHTYFSSDLSSSNPEILIDYVKARCD